VHQIHARHGFSSTGDAPQKRHELVLME